MSAGRHRRDLPDSRQQHPVSRAPGSPRYGNPAGPRYGNLAAQARTVPVDSPYRNPPGPPYGAPGSQARTVPVTPPRKIPRGRGRKAPESKVPDATPSFWVTKVLTTCMGEATSDYLVHAMNPYLAVFLGAVFFAVSFLLQMSARRYVVWRYWLAVTGVGVFGTMVADVLHVALGVPYAVSAPLFAIVLAAVFVTWRATEKTLSIHSIYTRRRELFYWAAVVATFALGTAAGDMTAATLGLGYLASAFMFVAIIMIPAVGYRVFGMNPVLAFWFAYVVTRPVGASFADWLGFPPSVGGVGLGHGPVALVLTIMIAVCVVYMTLRERAPRRTVRYIPARTPAPYPPAGRPAPYRAGGRPGPGDAATRALPGRAGWQPWQEPSNVHPLPGRAGERPWPDAAGGRRGPDRGGGYPVPRRAGYDLAPDRAHGQPWPDRVGGRAGPPPPRRPRAQPPRPPAQERPYPPAQERPYLPGDWR
ncbi:MAG TPA: hypothetical protein VKV80_04455 [Streptosporangiaceae bacterium]|nr:hypothetical protein [Streptosporangiaceae bacterium]